MTNSIADLVTRFTNVNEGVAPDAATQLLLASYAGQAALTDAAALNQALHIAPPADGSVGSNTPESTTDVALGVYQFFTGMAPTLGGLDFLVDNDGGAPLNPNDLDSAYYAGFNQANRYYNFAINLITGNPGVAASFAAAYGGESFNQVVVSAYEQIVGTPNVGAAAATAAIAAIEAQQPYFAQVAAERAPHVNQDLATKAVMIGYILEEAVKSDVGYYAFAIDQFNTMVAANPEAVIPGEGANGINLLTAFPIVGQTFTLTPGLDTITAPNTNNNTVVGTELTFTAGDSINLGATTGNVFNWTDPSIGGGFDTVVPAGAAVAGVQTFNVSSASRGVDVNGLAFPDLTTLNGDIHASSRVALSAGSHADINLNYTLTGDATGDVNIDGGRNVNVVENNPNGFNPPVTWITANTGSVSISQNGEGAATGSTGNVFIVDYYSTIVAADLSGMGDNIVEVVGQRGPFALSHLSITNSEDTTFYFPGSTGHPVIVTLANNSGDIRIEDTSGNPLTLMVTLGAQPGNDQFVFDTIAQNQLFLVGSAGSTTADLSRVTGDSFLTPTAAAQMSIVTAGLNLISGLTHGDLIVLPVADALHSANNLAGVAGEAELATGTYSVGGGTFTHSAGGADALLTYDSGGGHFVSVILVGGAAEAAHATISGGAIAW